MEPSEIIAELRRRANKPVSLTIEEHVNGIFAAYDLRLVGYAETSQGTDRVIRANPHINDLMNAPPFTADQVIDLLQKAVKNASNIFYDVTSNAFTIVVPCAKSLQRIAEAMTATKDEQIQNLKNALDGVEMIAEMLKRALRQQLLEQPDRRAEVIIDVSDLNIPDAPDTVRFFLDSEEELDLE